MNAWFICGGCLSDLPLERRVFLVHRCGHGCGYCSACAVVRTTDPCLACDTPSDLVPLRESEERRFGPCEAWKRPTFDVAPRQCTSYATRVVNQTFLCGNHTIKIPQAEVTMLPPPLQFKVHCSAEIAGRKGRPLRRCNDPGVAMLQNSITLCARHVKEVKQKYSTCET